MTKTFDNTNRGSVWGNTEKKSENAPTHTGKGNITVSTINLEKQDIVFLFLAFRNQ